MADDVPKPEKPKRVLLAKLSPKHERFCQLYTTYWEATRAARESGYSEKSAGRMGWELLQDPLIRARIAELRDHALEEIGCTRERVLAELAALSFYNISDATDAIGQLKPIREMPESLQRAVSKVKVNELFAGQGEERQVIGFTKEIEFAPKKGAIDSLTKIMGIAPDQLELTGKNGAPIEHKDVTALTDEQLDARHEALLAKAIAARAGKEEG